MFNQVWTPERKQRIQEINFSLGTKHRIMPFDLKNHEDLQEIIEQASGYYVDSLKIAGKLSELGEIADESLEIFFPAQWAEISTSEISGDTALQRLCLLLGEMEIEKQEMLEDAEKACKDAWEIFLSCAAKDVAKKLTTATNIKNVDWEDVASRLMDMDNLPYSVEESAEIIGKILGDLTKKKRKKVH